MIITSIKPQAELSSGPSSICRETRTLEHYRDLSAARALPATSLNSMVIACGAALIGSRSAIPAAYAFSRFRFRGPARC